MFANILLAVDGSDHSLKAAKSAGDLARLSGGTLRTITAYEELPIYLGEPNLSKAIAERTE
ncbi:MAG: universal stress protein [Chloroflexi bacterium]|nr:universal stress protein [Chloroflexota bacterium]